MLLGAFACCGIPVLLILGGGFLAGFSSLSGDQILRFGTVIGAVISAVGIYFLVRRRRVTNYVRSELSSTRA